MQRPSCDFSQTSLNLEWWESMASPPYIPIFGSDYLADTRHLTTEEHGAYFLLMIAAWRQDGCCLPLDDKKLSRITGLSSRRWLAIKDTILEFWTIENDRIFQGRLRKERDYADQKSNKNRNSANARWDKQATENIESDVCERVSERNAPQPQPQPQPQQKKLGESEDSLVDCETVIVAWNTMASASGLSICTKMTGKRRQACQARIRDDGMKAIRSAIERVPKSSFLLGENGSWAANIDFLLRPDSVTKILEGKYDNRGNGNGGKNRGSAGQDNRTTLARAIDEGADFLDGS